MKDGSPQNTSERSGLEQSLGEQSLGEQSLGEQGGGGGGGERMRSGRALSGHEPLGERAAVSAYELLGGEGVLRAIIDDFVERVVSDMMIGFLFRKVDKLRLKELEFQFASRHLGGPHRYEGRPLPEAHRAHSIMGGQFNRRLRLLERTLEDHGADPEIRDLWLRHNEKLRAQITENAADECAAPPAALELKLNREKESNN